MLYGWNGALTQIPLLQNLFWFTLRAEGVEGVFVLSSTPGDIEHTDVDTLQLNGKHTAYAYKVVEARVTPHLAPGSSLFVCRSSSIVIRAASDRVDHWFDSRVRGEGDVETDRTQGLVCSRALGNNTECLLERAIEMSQTLGTGL